MCACVFLVYMGSAHMHTEVQVYMPAYMQGPKKDAKCPALPLPGSFLCDRSLTEREARLAASKLQQYLWLQPPQAGVTGTCSHT